MSDFRVPSLVDVFAARTRLTRHLQATPLLHSMWLSSAANASVHLKVESLQPARSFKIRGALNVLQKAADANASTRTVVTASAGNHGRAMALAARLLGFRAIVFTPSAAPATKKAAIRALGAELRDQPADYDAAETAARERADREGAPYVSPYNHPDVIAGAGTIALELLDTLPVIDVVVVPLGGGGLASGLSIALKRAAPHVRIVGVEVEASTPFATGIRRGDITRIDVQPSLADGLTGNLEPGSMTFDIVRGGVDRLVAVSEQELRQAVRGLAAEEHLVAEGAGAAATAAVLAGRAVDPGERAVVMLTGGNIDIEKFASIVA